MLVVAVAERRVGRRGEQVCEVVHVADVAPAARRPGRRARRSAVGVSATMALALAPPSRSIQSSPRRAAQSSASSATRSARSKRPVAAGRAWPGPGAPGRAARVAQRPRARSRPRPATAAARRRGPAATAAQALVQSARTRSAGCASAPGSGQRPIDPVDRVRVAVSHQPVAARAPRTAASAGSRVAPCRPPIPARRGGSRRRRRAAARCSLRLAPQSARSLPWRSASARKWR